MADPNVSPSNGFSLADFAGLATVAVLALTELMRRTFRTQRGHKAFVDETITPMKAELERLTHMTLAHDNDIARNVNRIEEIERHGSKPTRSLIRMMYRMDKNLALLAQATGAHYIEPTEEVDMEDET